MPKFAQFAKQIDTSVCDICGKEFVTGYGYSMTAAWLVTGHSHIEMFNCTESVGGQHWGCTPQHAMQALIMCLQHEDHLSIEKLQKKHTDADPKRFPRVAAEDQWIQDTLGDNFPFTGRVAEKIS